MSKLLPKTAKNPSGFTLVELLVVISIIAVLAVVGITIFTGVQKNARDARRKVDIEAISKALEAHYNSQSGYPASNTSWFSGAVYPTDPTNSANYQGMPTATGFSYEVCADLEEDTRSPNDATPKDFCRTQQQ